ncbi:NAD-dependent epimerase/dehydratase family protein [Massilia litorea]|uniref:GDP-mannose 4,6-dehydratase n=1 Tax=Massilia litorea TaxID=2769491 RepID=A0A7L9U3N8_9BURK|nr:NAD-dependent epimerase/dehydratase family protein [Massilia litorea]QOL49019.1 GDP-mannose 4,6-dehydratase [Massilia litorea]
MIPAGAPVLVTGAAGFIGSFVASRLARMGAAVAACDNFNDYYPVHLKHGRVQALLAPHGIRCEAVELADALQVDRLFDRVRPAYVVHLAAQAGVRYSIEHPAAYVQSNLVAFANILEACRRFRPRHLVYASSSSVYGASENAPFRESDRTDEPVSFYGATKKANEVLAHSYSHLFGFPATGLRFFTVYGPWGRPDMAYFSFAQKMLEGEAIPVFAQGALERDFTYIDDIVEAVVRVAAKPAVVAANVAPHTVFNVGNHQPVRVLDFIAALEEVVGVKARIAFLPMQPGDVPLTYADTSKLQEWVGFAPATSLREGLGRFREWLVTWMVHNKID